MEIAAIILAAGQGHPPKSVLPNRYTELAGGQCWHGHLMPRLPLTPATLSVCYRASLNKSKTGWMAVNFAFRTNHLVPGMRCLPPQQICIDFDGVALIMFADTPLVTADTLTRLASSIDEKQALLCWDLKQLIRMAMAAL